MGAGTHSSHFFAFFAFGVFIQEESPAPLQEVGEVVTSYVYVT